MTDRLVLLGALAAFLVAVAALAFAWASLGYVRRLDNDLRAHRNAHRRAHGTPDPERRTRTDGPPPGTPDRRHRDPEPHRGAHAAPTTTTLPAQQPDQPPDQPPAGPRTTTIPAIDYNRPAVPPRTDTP